MHPWKNIGAAERKQRHQEFRQWLRDNPDKRLHAGAVREDGKVFLGYGYGYAEGENWTSPENYEERKKYSRLKLRRLRKDPEFKKRFNHYIKHEYKNRSMRLENTRVRGREYRQKYPWKIAQRQRFRYALKRSRIHPELDRAAEMALFAEARRLTVETGIEHHVDHIIPLKAGGWHHHRNLQVLPITVNLEKSFDPFWEKEGYKSWQDVPPFLWPMDLWPEYLRRLPISA